MISKGLDTVSKYHILEQNWLRSSVRRFDFHRDLAYFQLPRETCGGTLSKGTLAR